MEKRIGQKGFTLIEIIAVLVILGILAAVAIPKYQDLKDQAGIKSADGAAAAGQSLVSMAYSKLMLENNGTVPAVGDIVTEAACGTNVTGDFTVTCTAGTGEISIVAVSKTNPAYTSTKTWTLP